MRLIIAAMAVLAGGSLAADELADFQSREFANEAREALAAGDRSGALVAAMKGLPADPEDEDIARFDEAYDALLRAFVSRAVQLDLPVMSVFEFDGTGKRLASVGLMPSPDGDQSRTSLTLWDPRSGEKVSDLLPIGALTDGAWGVQAPAFSPDGRFLAQMAPVDGVAVVFDASTGEEITRLPGHEPGTLPNSGGLAFSRDGSYLMTLGSSPTVAHMWDTSSWERVASAEFNDYTLLSPIDGGRDGVMHFIAGDVSQGNPPPVELWSIAPEGASLIHRFPDEPSGLGAHWGRIATDDEDRLFALPNGNFDLMVFERATGAEIARLSSSVIGQSTGIVAPSGDGVLLLSSIDASPRRLTFGGEDAPLQPLDKLVGIHAVFSPGGELLGGSPDLLDYRGEDLPRGFELYHTVLETLPADARSEIASEQVMTE
ncbi:WD40 repeat domain-containing protein (plasmid) [Roseivivax marinus]|uniref:WD40 repeat domain-containing protein n=1 Tax=Roseivivax marinus TaxID=1379903 RepID=UPI001F04C109|nr:WD40 repeat domain-containing protein [Roseivivax marinus]UMA67214.1 WD40 repeat domain-containing protein [Roseivivax marinus]